MASAQTVALPGSQSRGHGPTIFPARVSTCFIKIFSLHKAHRYTLSYFKATEQPVCSWTATTTKSQFHWVIDGGKAEIPNTALHYCLGTKLTVVFPSTGGLHATFIQANHWNNTNVTNKQGMKLAEYAEHMDFAPGPSASKR
eukprot:1798798-Amphidinium_carterae.3